MEDVSSLLNEWKLSSLENKLHSYGSKRIESLEYITEKDLDGMFEESELAKKVQFRYKLKNWLQQHNKEYNDETFSRNLLIEIHSAICGKLLPKTPLSINEYDLNLYINSLPPVVYKSYLSTKDPTILSQKGRTLIVQNAVDFYLGNSKFMEKRDFLFVANQI